MKIWLVLSILLSLTASENSFSAEKSCSTVLLERVQSIVRLVHEGGDGIDDAKRLVLTDFNDVTKEELEEADYPENIDDFLRLDAVWR